MIDEKIITNYMCQSDIIPAGPAGTVKFLQGSCNYAIRKKLREYLIRPAVEAGEFRFLTR